MTDTRNWKCFFRMHQWGEPFAKGRYSHSNDLGSERNGSYYTCRCAHCGKIKTFYV